MIMISFFNDILTRFQLNFFIIYVYAYFFFFCFIFHLIKQFIQFFFKFSMSNILHSRDHLKYSIQKKFLF